MDKINRCGTNTSSSVFWYLQDQSEVKATGQVWIYKAIVNKTLLWKYREQCRAKAIKQVCTCRTSASKLLLQHHGSNILH